MTWTLLYLRSRRVPLALAVSVGGAVLIWGLWLALADSRDAARVTVVLTVLLMVAVLSTTLAGPDDHLERIAAMRWPWRRAVHLVAALLVVSLVLSATLPTAARFGPAALVVRDAAGLLGLTALGTATFGAARAWLLPLLWTTIAAVYPQDGTGGAVVTWQAQGPQNTAAAVTAGVLALGGLVAWSFAGPAGREAAEYIH
ncbi:hypothetical protein [Micromonospora sp. KC213]|uniref:hypothetical protein n=1 Tax=Micromonospora sp. KC213 TaxID=2530378 RepID=UPI00104C0A89|nr:hypothetical protein [Micromonospora sp. KC213]TDC44283.1 hypothetical protein E1166_00330 [Micromonospora sp. KC213]